jgi:hypothetical protein
LTRPSGVARADPDGGAVVVVAEAAGRSIAELEAARDDAIIGIIAGRGEVGDACG